MSEKQLKRLLRRKPIRRKKIGRCEEKKLMRRGTADLNKGIVRKNENQQYSSPFIRQEVFLCLVQINAEKQTLAEILTCYKNEIIRKKFQIQGLKSYIETIDFPEKPDDCDECIRYDGEELMKDSIVQSFRISEYNQKLKARQQQKADIASSMEILNISENEDQYAVQKEIDITKYRCLQHYNLLLARLSAYWNGVLRAKSEGVADISSMFYATDLLQDLRSEIEMLERKEADCDDQEEC